MYQIAGKAKAGKNRLLQMLAVNTLQTKVLAVALVDGISGTEKVREQTDPSASSNPIVSKSLFEQEKFMINYDCLVAQLREKEVDYRTAISMLNVGNFIHNRGGNLQTSDLSLKIIDDCHYSIVLTENKIKMIVQWSLCEEKDNEHIFLHDAWISCEALTSGVELDGIPYLIFEGVSQYPTNYVYAKRESSKGNISLEANDVIELSEILDNLNKMSNKNERITLFFDDMNLFLTESSKNLRNIGGDELVRLGLRYKRLSKKISSISDIVDINTRQLKPFISPVLAYKDDLGRMNSFSQDAASVIFTICRTPCLIDSMLPLAFISGSTAVSGGISSKALLIASLSTFSDCFATFPLGSFLGETNDKWEPLLSGAIYQAGSISQFDFPMYFTSRKTGRNIKHFLISVYNCEGKDVVYWRPGLSSKRLYISIDGQIVTFIEKNLDRVFKIAMSSDLINQEDLDFDGVPSLKPEKILEGYSIVQQEK